MWFLMGMIKAYLRLFSNIHNTRKLTQREVQDTIGVARNTRKLPKLFGGDVDEYALVSFYIAFV